MSKSEWFVVPNIDEFALKARSIVYANFGSWENNDNYNILIDSLEEKDQEELDKILSQQESLVIIIENLRKEKNKRTNKTRYVLNDQIFADIIAKLNERMVSNIISNLVQKGLVETAFDSEANDFVFWVKENESNIEKEKPETD